jgi:Zn-dependent M28 family amino/carboxypeptidase
MRWIVVVLAACGSSSSTPPVDPVAAVEAQRFSADLATIAQPRAPGSPHWQAVQDLCAARFAELGYEVERHDYGTGVNVIGVRTGTELPAERVMVSAHYDSTSNCDGADDNATGVAGTLEAARVLSLAPHARTLAVACWDEEERGLIGSTAYVQRADAAGEQIVASYVFEMIGYRSSEPSSQTTDPNLAAVFPDQEAAIAANEYRGDFILLIHDEGAAGTVADFNATATAVGLKTVALDVNNALKVAPGAAGLRRSDHAPFWFADYPAIMITDTANFRNPHYHCGGGPDVVADVDVEFATMNVKSVAGAVAAALDR